MNVLHDMAAALRVNPRQQAQFWVDDALAIGLFELPPAQRAARTSLNPTHSLDHRFTLWVTGEAFTWHGQPVGSGAPAEAAFKRDLVERLARESGAAIRELNGEYQLAVLDRQDRTLSLYTDRFSGLPLYWSANKSGVAFAGGVRGVLMAPGVEPQADPEAIREAVTFGGFRLGTRTNIVAIEMAPASAHIKVRDAQVQVRRYWTWHDAPEPTDMPEPERLRQTQCAWQGAITARLSGSGRPGLLLSGGLDSRAILAEARRHVSHVTAVTYGVPQSDDVRIARRAAKAANAEWHLFPLYAPGWVERRLSHVHGTDGLVNFVDLMHAEVLPTLPEMIDVYLSGYLGDLVSGSTYGDVASAEDLLHTLPYYGGELGMPLATAKARAAEMIAQCDGAAPFAVYNHKLFQAISRITEAARPWVRVRRPFVDYGFWSQAYRVPTALRRNHHWHEHWLCSTYPELFARIPNQRTGVPVGASLLRHQVTRAVRFGWRRTLSLARRAGVPATVPERTYHPDWAAWREPAVRDLITRTTLRADSISAEIFGRSRVAATLDAYFERDAAPIQVVGALFAFEHYHQSLSTALSEWRSERNRP